MKQITITLTTVIIFMFTTLTTVAQMKTTIPDEVHLLQNPFKPMNILVIPANIEGVSARQGDLVMAFDGSTCVGAAVVADVKKVLNLVATCSDEVNKGYKAGQTIRLEYHSIYDNTVYDLIPTKIMLGSMNYEELGTLYADFEATTLSIDENDDNQIVVYPNPVSHQLHIIMDLDKATSGSSINLKLVNIAGKVLLTNDYNLDNSVINLNVAGLSPGEYTLLLANDEVRFTQKVIKK